MKLSQLQLFVMCNIYGEPSNLFEVHTDEVSALTLADKQNALHQDDNTLYGVISLYHYVQTMLGNYDNLLNASNEYHSDTAVL